MKSFITATLLFSMTVLAAVAGAAGTGPQIKNAKAITSGGHYLAPRFSPDGLSLMVSGPAYRGLFLMNTSGGDVRVLTSDDRAGVFARFSLDGAAVLYETMIAEKPATIRLGLLGERSKVDLALNRSSHPTLPLAAEVDEHRIMIVKNGERVLVSPPGDKFYSPQFSPDGRWLMFQGVASGIYLHRLGDGSLRRVGSGNHPQWSPGSQFIVFDRTQDDGERMLAGDIYLVSLKTGKEHRLTRTPRLIEQRPAISPDGKRIAFDAGGAIYLGGLAGL